MPETVVHQDGHIDELARPQRFVLVGGRRLQGDRAGRLVDGIVDEGEQALGADPAAAADGDLDRKRSFRLSGPQCRELRLRHREQDGDRPGLVDGDQRRRVVGLDVGAHLERLRARCDRRSVRGRSYSRAARADCRSAPHRRQLRLRARRRWRVRYPRSLSPRTLARRAPRCAPGCARHRRAAPCRERGSRFSLGELGARRAVIQLEQHVAREHIITLGEADLDDQAVDARLHGDRGQRRDSADLVDEDRHVAHFDRRRAHRDRLLQLVGRDGTGAAVGCALVRGIAARRHSRHEHDCQGDPTPSRGRSGCGAFVLHCRR